MRNIEKSEEEKVDTNYHIKNEEEFWHDQLKKSSVRLNGDEWDEMVQITNIIEEDD